MKKKTIFIIALVMAGLATFLFYQYTNQLSRAATAVEEMKTVIAAAVPINKDQKITEDMLKKIEIPAKLAHPDAAQDVSEITGQSLYATTDIAEDEVILKHHLQPLDAADDLAGKIKEEKRAVTLPGGVVETLANMIEPEDTIDIVYTGPPLATTTDAIATSAATAKILETMVLQENVRVLAVGRRIHSNEEFKEYDSITVEVSEKEAVNLIRAAKSGALTFILHSKRTTADPNGKESSS